MFVCLFEHFIMVHFLSHWPRDLSFAQSIYVKSWPLMLFMPLRNTILQ